MNARAPIVWLLTLTLCGCNFAPDYAPPAVKVPAGFKEDKLWTEARPRDDAPRGPWWCSLNDKTLNELEPRIDVGNQSLAAQVAVLEQASAYIAQAQAGLFPSVNLVNSYSSNKQSQHRPLRTSNRVPTAPNNLQSYRDDRPLNQPDHYGNNMLYLQSSYEVDLWGRVRNVIAAAEAQTEARLADLESIRLSFQAELARDYVALRGLDSEIALYNRVVESYRVRIRVGKDARGGQDRSARRRAARTSAARVRARTAR